MSVAEYIIVTNNYSIKNQFKFHSEKYMIEFESESLNFHTINYAQNSIYEYAQLFLN